MSRWPQVGDDVSAILQELQGEEDYPKGFAGLVPTSVAAGATLPVNCPLTAYLKSNRLVLNPAAIVDLSYVQDIKVGTISLNVGSQPVPASAFARDAVGTTIDAAVWATPSVPPVVYIFNNTAAAIVYSGGFFGPVSLKAPS